MAIDEELIRERGYVKNFGMEFVEGRIIPFSMLSGPTGDSLPNLVVPLPSSLASNFCLLIRLSGIKSSLTLGAPKGQHINKSSSGDRVATSKLLQPVAAPQ